MPPFDTLHAISVNDPHVPMYAAAIIETLAYPPSTADVDTIATPVHDGVYKPQMSRFIVPHEGCGPSRLFPRIPL